MFRFQRMLSMQAQACQKLSAPFSYASRISMMRTLNVPLCIWTRRFGSLRASAARPGQALGFCSINLRAIDAQLATIESVQTSVLASNHPENLPCRRSRPSGFGDIWLRLRSHDAGIGAFPPRGANVTGAVRGLCVHSVYRPQPRLLV